MRQSSLFWWRTSLRVEGWFSWPRTRRWELGRDLFGGRYADFISDAGAGVAFPKTSSEVDPHKLGLVGHSQGDIETALSAVDTQDVPFIVRWLPQELGVRRTSSASSDPRCHQIPLG